eukprot:Blabericola_migrator_1__2785@NODE_1798_length_3778_cov_307_576125_g1119_i1_p1_GENE_NODE_1798_length_3778_cov_307_576125_g1119_i1NODE_1798_length_3778_cov_307_576125_g1119_i1_p1_ORF_typecomplete_len713_score86_57RINGv/PF12906_7/2_1e15FHA/PF00498_26/5_1e02FHA/PF00498_26/4_8e08YopYscD_cpl/PF16697_5/12YopYscD_cpl/PF16697_5/0_00011YopYscD_cpl/PF16697_5/1_1e03FANCL_C/PF11793_8/0_0064FHA_2/PF17913_1/6_6e02FHA_2/PF17913_1/0_28zfRING_2/PF13639_6/0_079PHD_4/PF16866_5/8_8PHD_4/PF16866_5/1_3e03_NODE_1798_le
MNRELNAGNNVFPSNNPLPRASIHGPFVGFTLKTSTWVSNSHGLYDYESHNVSAKTYRCRGRSNVYRILRKGVDVSLVDDVLGQELLAEDQAISTIAKLTALEEGGYKVEPSSPDEDREIRYRLTGTPARPLDHVQETILKEEARFWVVTKSLRDGSIALKDGDTIKLGRFAFNVRQVVLDTNQERKSGTCPDEDDVATCETRRSDTVVNNPTAVPFPSSGGAAENEEAPYHPEPPNVYECDSDSESMSSSNSDEDICDIRRDYHHPSLDVRSFDNVRRQPDAPPLREVLRRRDTGFSNSGDNSSSHSLNGTAAEPDTLVTGRTVAHQISSPGSPFVSAQLPIPSALSSSEAGAAVCRICLSEEEDPKENPLVSPCKCNGSMKWIHLQCLRTWMEGRLNIKVDDVGSSCFFWRPLECELCQEPYPTYVDVSQRLGGLGNDAPLSQPVPPRLVEEHQRSTTPDDPISRALRVCADPPANSSLVELFRIPKPAVPFVILESKHQPSGNIGFHFLSFSTRDSVRLGRGHEADVRVADISVSRLHATLRYQASPDALISTLRTSQPGAMQSGGFTPLRSPLGHIENPADIRKPYVYIEDLKSKFGTLIAIDKPIFLYPRMMLSVQVGRTVLTLYIRKPSWSRFIPSCFHLYYKGIISKCRRKQPHLNKTSQSRIPSGYDTHDVRLLETYLPLSLAVAGHEPSVIEQDAPENLSQSR